MTIKTIIVDDEKLAIQGLQLRLEKFEDVEIIDTCSNGREAIRAMFEHEFATAQMECIPENLFEDGEWAILEWRDPKGLRGCGFFHVIDGQIALQRGYWDRLSFEAAHKTE